MVTWKKIKNKFDSFENNVFSVTIHAKEKTKLLTKVSMSARSTAAHCLLSKLISQAIQI